MYFSHIYNRPFTLVRSIFKKICSSITKYVYCCLTTLLNANKFYSYFFSNYDVVRFVNRGSLCESRNEQKNKNVITHNNKQFFCSVYKFIFDNIHYLDLFWKKNFFSIIKYVYCSFTSLLNETKFYSYILRNHDTVCYVI